MDVGRASNKTQYSFMVKTLSTLKIEGNVLHPIRGVYKYPQLTSHLVVKV